MIGEWNKIVIVGGGSAGWMTAAILIKDFPDKEIVLIESPNIPIVGVGESTYDGINYYLEYLEIDRDDFFKYTDASIKLGIEFSDFYDVDSGNFVYPFGIADVRGTKIGMQDWTIKKYIDPDLPVTDFAETFYPAAHLIKYNTFNENLDNQLPKFNSKINTALHFDATKFSLWLKEKYCLPRGVKNILADVDDIVCNDNGIEYLRLNNGENIDSDIFIDCTGFKALLIDKTMKEPFISYNDVLPNNRAWATQIPYLNKEIELKNTTRCTAMENGWCWNIPLYSRLGSGYVYSNKYISKEEALEEFKEYLMKKIDIPRSRDFVDSLSYKDISMRVGIHERVWVKNVVAVGLSAGFIEPLESNGLFSVHEFLFSLVDVLKRKKITSWSIFVFNETVRGIFDAFAEFIRLHYALSIRTDSQYWIDNAKREYDFSHILAKEMPFKMTHLLYDQRTRTNEMIPSGGFASGVVCISAGMNFLAVSDTRTRISEINRQVDFKEYMKRFFIYLDERKQAWDNIAQNSPNILDYLERKYYG